MPPGTQEAITAARFSITIDGYEIASFSELQGITTSVEVVDNFASSDKEVTLSKLPGRRNPPTIILKRGKNSSMEFWSWHESVLMGDMTAARRSCSLVMYSASGEAVARYHMEHAWPAKIEIGALKAGTSEVLMETVTLVCEHIQRVAP
jgi:phage tail-like protein